MNHSKKSSCRFLAASAVLLSAAACGGGGSTPAPAPTPVVNTLGGTAAVGSPIVGGTVKVVCSSGPANASVLTTSAGAWQASVTGQTLPCAVQVSGGTIRGNPNTTPYHALALSFGVVNLTPLTDLLVANQAASATPASWFTALGTSTTPLQSLGQTQADAALSKLRAALGALAPLATVNPVTTPFTAAPGNISDDILSSLQIALTNLSMSYTSLLGNAAVSGFTPPTGLGAAIGTAYATTPSGTPAVAIAPAPTNLQVAVTSQSQLNLTWAAATGATSYNVYRSTSPSVQLTAGNKIATSTTATSLQDTGLTASTAYYYKVTAVNSAGESLGSAEVTGTTPAPAVAVPSAPTGVSATAASASQINMAWTGATNATGYNVYRSTAANVAITAANKLTATPTAAYTFIDTTGLAAATAYFYKVTAVNAAGESVLGSNEANATTGAAVPTAAFVVRTNPVGATTKAPTHVVWTGSKFIALEQSTDFHNTAATFFTWTSADGSSWTRNTTNMVSNYPNMSTANGLAFQLPGSTTGSPFTINSSSDGITWVASTATYTGFAVPRTVKYLNGKYFISMDVDTCTVISSTNASTWTSTDLRTLALPTGYTKRINNTYCSEPIFLGGKYLVYGGAIEFFVKNATSYLTQGLVYSSTDGVNWTASGFALPTDVNAIPQDGRSRTVLQIGDTVVIPSVRTETQVRIKPTDPFPTQVITNEQVGTSTDGLTFTYTKATGIAANANTLVYYPSLPLPGGMLATTSTSTLVNSVSVFTYSYYFTTNGSTYTSAPDFKVGEGGYNSTPFAYSPTLKRLVFLKQETRSFSLSGVTINTYDFP